jgi:hypothetical protein
MSASSRHCTRFARTHASCHRLLTLLALGVVAGALLTGCGGGSGGGGSDLAGPSASEFGQRFDKVTGIQLVNEARTDNDSWAVFALPDGTDHFDRFGAFSIYIVKDKDARDRLMSVDDKGGDRLDTKASGYAFRRNESSDSYSVLQQFGENIVLVWQAGDKQQVDASYGRLTAAIEAASTGDESKVPASQRDCAQSGIDPDSGKEGTCRVGDREITVVDSGSELTTPVLKAHVTSVADSAQIKSSLEYGTDNTARGRFLIVTYELTNSGNSPIEDLEPMLTVDGKTYSNDHHVEYDLYPEDEKPLPLQPGDSTTIKTAFDVSPEVVDAARDHGALVLPAEADDSGYLSVDGGAAEGRIRLAGADGASTSPDYGEARPSSAPRPSSSKRTLRREHRAERAVKQFFTAVRSGNVSSICTRLTELTISKQGGLSVCRTKVVRSTFQRQVPGSSKGLRFTTILSRGDTRATVMVAKNGYRGIVRLARQQGLWRIQGLKRIV